jgi:hypothetical protein
MSDTSNDDALTKPDKSSRQSSLYDDNRKSSKVRKIKTSNRQKLKYNTNFVTVTPKLKDQARRRVGQKNKSGFRGVWFWEKKKKWTAKIRVNGKNVWLGLFETKEKASKAYQDAFRSVYGNIKPFTAEEVKKRRQQIMKNYQSKISEEKKAEYRENRRRKNLQKKLINTIPSKATEVLVSAVDA